MPEISRPEVVAEVTAAIRRYEEALFANDVPIIPRCRQPPVGAPGSPGMTQIANGVASRG